MKTSLCLNVDWDFFFNEDPIWDWGHKETPFFTTAIWEIRFKSFYPRRLDKFFTHRKEYVRFWKDLQFKGFDFSHTFGIMGDSNISAFWALNSATRILSFDNHHDILYHEEFTDMLDCGNWMGQLLRKRKSTTAQVVYLNERRMKEEFSFSNELPLSWVENGRLSATDFHSLSKGGKVDRVFICRSSAWTPPWSDKALIKLLTLAPFPIAPISKFPGSFPKDLLPDPMLPREWNLDKSLLEAESKHKILEDVRSKYNVEGNSQLQA